MYIKQSFSWSQGPCYDGSNEPKAWQFLGPKEINCFVLYCLLTPNIDLIIIIIMIIIIMIITILKIIIIIIMMMIIIMIIITTNNNNYNKN